MKTVVCNIQYYFLINIFKITIDIEECDIFSTSSFHTVKLLTIFKSSSVSNHESL